MNKLFLLLVLSMGLGTISAQSTSNLIFFAEQGERFYVVLNGLRINDAPATNVRVTDLTAAQYKLKVIFENKAFGEMDKNVFMEMGTETTYNIKKNNKGEWKLGLISAVPIAQAPAPPPSQVVYTFGNPVPVSGQTTVVEQTTTTTTSGSNTGNGGGVGINMSVNDGTGSGNVNFNMNVGVNGTSSNTGVNMNMSGSQTTTTTTTTTTSSSGGGWATEPAPVASAGCVAMNSTNFQSAKNSISGKSFEDSKLTLAKQIIDKNCMSSAQIKEVMGLFSFEETKLTFAKHAYSHCLDTNNYYLVNEAFGFESSIEELDEYISGK